MKIPEIIRWKVEQYCGRVSYYFGYFLCSRMHFWYILATKTCKLDFWKFCPYFQSRLCSFGILLVVFHHVRPIFCGKIPFVFWGIFLYRFYFQSRFMFDFLSFNFCCKKQLVCIAKAIFFMYFFWSLVFSQNESWCSAKVVEDSHYPSKLH